MKNTGRKTNMKIFLFYLFFKIENSFQKQKINMPMFLNYKNKSYGLEKLYKNKTLSPYFIRVLENCFKKQFLETRRKTWVWKTSIQVFSVLKTREHKNYSRK